MPPSAPTGHPILHPFAHAAAGFYAAQAQNNYQHNAHYYQQQQQLPETGMPHNLGGHAAPHAHAAQRDAAGGDAYDPFADTTPPPSPSSASPAQTSVTAATSKQSPHVETHAAGAHEPEAKRQKVDHAAAGHAAGAACTAGASASSPGTGAPASASDGLQPRGTDWCPGTVLMWDLDETLIVFNSLLMGKVPGGPVPPALSQSLLEKAEILEVLLCTHATMPARLCHARHASSAGAFFCFFFFSLLHFVLINEFCLSGVRGVAEALVPAFYYSLNPEPYTLNLAPGPSLNPNP